MPWLHLANGQGVGSEPQDLPVSSGLVTSLHWQQPTVTFPMGQALQVELEDAESSMRTPSPFDRDPEILHSFPGAVWGELKLQVAEWLWQESGLFFFQGNRMNGGNFNMFVILSRDQPT